MLHFSVLCTVLLLLFCTVALTASVRNKVTVIVVSDSEAARTQASS